MKLVKCLVFGLCCLLANAAEPRTGHLLVIGGGLRPENHRVYERLVQLAGGTKAQICILPTASTLTSPAERFAETVAKYGVPRQQIEILDLTIENGQRQAANPQLVAQLERCSCVYFTGGDQQRITAALLKADGSDSPALAAIRGVLKRGGVIAGSSAGAACQSQIMISVAGLPDETLDEGLDVLDFGLTKDAARRGLRISRGLGFFSQGIIDQHFHQYRGRLGRLTRAVIEQRVRFGLGIDENTAFHVNPDGQVEVLGAGCLTIVDAADGKCEDGPHGCRMQNVRVSCLEAGDRFHCETGKISVHRHKEPITAGNESNNGNFLIPDIAGEGAIWHALVSGLGDNTARRQVGVTLKHHQPTGHGYRFTFQKTDRTRSFAGYVDGAYSYSVVDAVLDIDPISLTLQSPANMLPVDLAKDPARKKIDAICFRGLMSSDDQRRFRPDVAVTRAELATAIVRTLRLEAPRQNRPVAGDVEEDPDLSEAVAKVVGAKIMALDGQAKFRPDATVTLDEASNIFSRMAAAYRDTPPAAEKFPLTNPVTRRAAAEAIYQVVGFPW